MSWEATACCYHLANTLVFEHRTQERSCTCCCWSSTLCDALHGTWVDGLHGRLSRGSRRSLVARVSSLRLQWRGHQLWPTRRWEPFHAASRSTLYMADRLGPPSTFFANHKVVPASDQESTYRRLRRPKSIAEAAIVY